MNILIQNFRFALRQLRKNPGFTVVAVLTLALGVGPNVAIFSIVWATFFRTTFPDEAQVVVVWTKIKGSHNGSYADDYLQYLNQSKSFQHLDFIAWLGPHLISDDGSEEPIAGDTVTPGLFTKTFRETMLMGRDFLPEEGIAGHEHVAILRYGLWQGRFHGDPNILGKQIRIEDEYYTVVGVVSSDPGNIVKFAIPVVLNPSGTNDYMGDIFGRLKPGVSLVQAEAELNVINKTLLDHRPTNVPKDAWSVGVEEMKNDWLDARSKTGLWLLLAAVGLVLLIACANLANLLLAKGTDRQTEIAVRTALGASHYQVLIQLLAESLLLAMVSAPVGMALGSVLLRLAKAQLGGMLLLVTDASNATINLPVLLFAIGVTAIAGILFGCIPAWHALKLNLSETLKQGSTSMLGGRRMRTQAVLVVAEFALAITLLGSAAMTMRSFWNLRQVDLGVRTDQVLVSELRLPMKQNPSRDERRAKGHRVMDALRALPEVADAALATTLPLRGYDERPFGIVGQTSAQDNPLMADFETVTPGYFSTIGGQLVRGRFLNDRDDVGSQLAVVVNETFVRQYLNNTDPLIHRIFLSGIPQVRELQIVGVFHDIRTSEQISEPPVPSVLGSFWQFPSRHPQLIVRSKPGTNVSAKEIRATIAATDPAMYVTDIRTMDDVVRTSLGGERFGSILFAAFSTLALLLAAVGVYGVMAFAVAQRRREIGLRIAMGAQPDQVARMVLRGGMKLAVFGLAIGVIGVLGIGRLMHGILYGVGGFDLENFVVGALVLFAAAALASYIPARRAAKVDPMVALRYE